ncbi:MAG TPA: response regulator [Flavobacterium sp.]|nr:response regulator [Flavobacterium sp.]
MPDRLCLLIDDDMDDREIFADALSDTNQSCRLMTAANGLEGMQILTDLETPPDVIFLDLNMPVMSGKQCLHEIRKTSKFNGIPVVIYTTSSYSGDIEETKQAGASHFLVKPASMRKLTEALATLLSSPEIPFFFNPED